ncbi:hypothetical protein NSE_0082 [Neorickettsia sennetsu str. Miyayama]|uniref:Uncharacterized protein n=1 Tax=Ehrlichia sennetsu (strain ATCC VR-367 / Miyayama) TaxID=222891 RepID=Q2GEW3_EHRS3|nr:hypothetical protein NSE_0082 [Neorickettsia sennetsu str. Miyayama]
MICCSIQTNHITFDSSNGQHFLLSQHTRTAGIALKHLPHLVKFLGSSQ